MASHERTTRGNFTVEEVIEMCARNENEVGSDIDSVTGGLSSGEEFEIDGELQDSSDFDEDMR